MHQALSLSPGIAVWGDRFGNLHWPKALTLVNQLAALTRRSVSDGCDPANPITYPPPPVLAAVGLSPASKRWFGTEIASACLTRVLLNPRRHQMTGVFWTGHDDGSDPPTFAKDRTNITDAIGGMAAAYGHGRFVVIGLTISYAVVALGAKEARIAINQALLERFGERFIDIATPLANYDPYDSLALANGWQGLQVSDDLIHLNTTGIGVVAKLVADRIAKLGY